LKGISGNGLPTCDAYATGSMAKSIIHINGINNLEMASQLRVDIRNWTILDIHMTSRFLIMKI
jgi:hypothetical protein